MKKAPIALLVAALSGGFALPNIDFRPDSKMIAEVGQALAAGVVLGANVWSYNVGPRPTEVEAGLLLRPAACEWQSECDSAAAAALTAGGFATEDE